MRRTKVYILHENRPINLQLTSPNVLRASIAVALICSVCSPPVVAEEARKITKPVELVGMNTTRVGGLPTKIKARFRVRKDTEIYANDSKAFAFPFKADLLDAGKRVVKTSITYPKGEKIDVPELGATYSIYKNAFAIEAVLPKVKEVKYLRVRYAGSQRDRTA